MLVSSVSDGAMWEARWLVSEVRLKATPSWEPGQEPPLSIEAAVGIARQQLKVRGLKHQAVVRNVSLQLPMRSQVGELHYVYFVSFDDQMADNAKPGEMDVVILLDGTVVTPVLKRTE